MFIKFQEQKDKPIKSLRNHLQITPNPAEHNPKQQPNKKQNPKHKHFSSTETQKKTSQPHTKRPIHIKDIAKANLNALEHNNADYKAISIETGKPITIKALAETLTKLYNKPNLKPHISNQYRKGDIRHCYANTTKAQKLLNFKPTISLEDGLTKLAEWAKNPQLGRHRPLRKSLKGA